MCAPVALVGDCLVSVRRFPSSQAWRITALRMLASRAITFSVIANSSSMTKRRLSSTPGSAMTV